MVVTAPDAGSDHRDRRGRVTAGNSNYFAKQKRLAERLEQLIAHFEGASAAEVQVLSTIARLFDDSERATTLTARIRASNAARRLLATIRPPKEKPPLTLREELALRKAKANV